MKYSHKDPEFPDGLDEEYDAVTKQLAKAAWAELQAIGEKFDLRDGALYAHKKVVKAQYDKEMDEIEKELRDSLAQRKREKAEWEAKYKGVKF